ncbi:3-keto-steroid reductase, partial [Coemansia biformis]
DGLGLTFQTNTFGHYLLIDRLTPLLASTGGARVIWTGSAASHLDFSPTDYQHIHGDKPYESSKYIVDQIVVPLDARLQKQGVRCYVTEPGNVCSGFLAGLGLPVIQLLIVAAFYLLRIVAGMPRFTITADHAATACVFVGLADDKALDPRIKYHSYVTRTGTPYVARHPLTARESAAAFLIDKLDSLVDRFTGCSRAKDISSGAARLISRC